MGVFSKPQSEERPTDPLRTRGGYWKDGSGQSVFVFTKAELGCMNLNYSHTVLDKSILFMSPKEPWEKRPWKPILLHRFFQIVQRGSGPAAPGGLSKVPEDSNASSVSLCPLLHEPLCKLQVRWESRGNIYTFKFKLSHSLKEKKKLN